jgi:CRP-like cAMP-binding protein
MIAAVPSVGVVEIGDHALVADQRRVAAVSAAFASGGLQRILASGEPLVRAGEMKTYMYRVETGLVFASWSPSTGFPKTVGFGFPGAVVGLGALDRHIVTIQANAPSVVQCLPRAALDELVAVDNRLASRHDAATNLELDLLRSDLVERGRGDALVRVSAFLSALASIDAQEGRGGAVIRDDVTCGFVADSLGLDVRALEDVLRNLAGWGLIAPLPGGGLRLIDRGCAGSH